MARTYPFLRKQRESWSGVNDFSNMTIGGAEGTQGSRVDSKRGFALSLWFAFRIAKAAFLGISCVQTHKTFRKKKELRHENTQFLAQKASPW